MSEETIEVTVKIPKKIIDFLKAQKEDLQSYLEYVIVDRVRADIDSQAFSDPTEVKEKYGLKQIFEDLYKN